MKCPHCLVEFRPEPHSAFVASDREGDWGVEWILCPSESCQRLIVYLTRGTVGGHPAKRQVYNVNAKVLVRPRGASRTPPAPEVPKPFADEYREACLVLVDSPKSSAALARRCLQRLLREIAKVKPGDLADEIQEVLDRKNLPAHLADQIDGVRNVGNFSAHPIKSKSTGEIFEVEPGEAEWNLDTLEGLFDFHFVLPARIKERREALDKKLKDAGKPPMK